MTLTTNAEIADYNTRWLKAWTDKDVDALCAFYSDDCVYKDPQTAAGLKGQAQLRAYLTGLFAATPRMIYEAEEVWPIPGGFCGRWYCQIGEGDGAARIRGFDLVLMDGDRIGHNEVYVHQLPA